MRLSDLRPEFKQVYADPLTCLQPLQVVELYFVCPKCGAPGTVDIKITTEKADWGKRLWHTDALPSGDGWPDRLTVAPSINCTMWAHGPHRAPCNAHFSIINGEII